MPKGRFAQVDGYITPLDFGALGDGTDQTTAMQAWAAALSAGPTVNPGFVPPGMYATSKPLLLTGTNTTIRGAGMYQNATIRLLDPTQDGLVFNGFNRLDLSDFVVESADIPTAGANIRINGSAGTYAGLINRIAMPQSFVGIASTGLDGFSFQDLDIGGLYPLVMADPGDSTIVGSRFAPTSGGIGMEFTGDCGGLKLYGPKVNGAGYRCAISMVLQKPDGDIQINGGSYEGWTEVGFVIDTIASVPFGNISIIGAQLAGSGRAIYFPNTARQKAVTSNVVIANNILQSTSGVYLDGLGYWSFQGNMMPDGTPLTIGANCVAGEVAGNRLSGGIVNQGVATYIGKNPGYN